MYYQTEGDNRMAISVETLTVFAEVLTKLKEGEPDVPVRIIIKVVEVREKGAKRP